MKKFTRLFVVSSAVCMVFACGGGKLGSKTKELNSLIEKHPEIKTASLKAIYDSADSGNDAELVADPAMHSDNGSLDKKVAKEAKTLIDSVLDAFSLKDFVEAGINIMGVVGEAEGLGDCKENVSKEKEDLKKQNSELEKIQKELPKKMRQCGKIAGGEFASCMDLLNKTVKFGKNEVTCKIKTIAELEKKAEKSLKIKNSELNKKTINCVENVFPKCEAILGAK